MRPERRRRRGYPTTLSLTHAHPILTYALSDEFARHGMSDIVTLTHRNVCKDGFTVTDTADAGALFLFTVVLEVLARQPLPLFPHLAFLDLPAPWEAIEHAKSALRVRAP
jgi:hypothetical protein